jgi:hypothetical protein
VGFFLQEEKVQIVAGTGRFTLKNNVALDNLTIWVVGREPAADITAQPQVNEDNFGGSATVTAAGGRARDVVFTANNPTDGRRLIPVNRGLGKKPLSPAGAQVSDFVFSLLLTSASDQDVDVYAVAEELSSH